MNQPAAVSSQNEQSQEVRNSLASNDFRKLAPKDLNLD